MPVDTSAPSSESLDVASHRPTGHGNRAGARKHAALNPATDARPSTIALAERERAAIELRKADCTYQQIADDLGYRSPAGARSAVLRGLGRWMREADEPLRVLELARADEIGRRLWPLMDNDDPHVALKAIATYLRLMDYRAKITGLYNAKPPRQEAVPTVDHVAEGEEVLARVHRLMVLTNQIRDADVEDGYGRGGDRAGQRDEVAAPDPTPGPMTLDDHQRLMELVNEMREQNAYGAVDPVVADPSH